MVSPTQLLCLRRALMVWPHALVCERAHHLIPCLESGHAARRARRAKHPGKFLGAVFRRNFPQTAGGSGGAGGATLVKGSWRGRRLLTRGLPAIEVLPGA
jgi:hypothetical protein